jgi:hypothetical protein
MTDCNWSELQWTGMSRVGSEWSQVTCFTRLPIRAQGYPVTAAGNLQCSAVRCDEDEGTDTETDTDTDTQRHRQTHTDTNTVPTLWHCKRWHRHRHAYTETTQQPGSDAHAYLDTSRGTTATGCICDGSTGPAPLPRVAVCQA